MFCPKCGENLPDGSKFCSACGTNLSDLVTEENVVPENIVPENVELENVRPENVSLENAGSGSTGSEKVPEMIPQPEFVQPKKKMEQKKLIGIAAIGAAALVVVVALIVIVTSIGKKDNAYVYLSDGKYELLTNLKEDENIEIASGKNDEVSPWMVAFSPDGKYVYYFTKYDSIDATATLCRAEYGKLKQDSDRNDKYIEVVETNVRLGFNIFEDGTLMYIRGDGTLYYFDGKEAVRVAKNVESYHTDDSKRVVYSTGDETEEMDLYGVDLNDIDNKIKLASNYGWNYAYVSKNLDEILYTKYDDDYNETLYSVGFEKDSEKLGENVSLYHIGYGDGTTYFTADNGSTLNPYEYVIDDYAEADAGITEPDYDDFEIPYYYYYMIWGSNISEGEFGELYTSCTKDLYWYGESTWWSYSMEDAVDIEWDSSGAVNTATQDFIDKYADSADEDGYILVTDEVKEDLKKINQAAGIEDWKWLWLCYTREQNGTTTDYDAYDAAYDKYYEAADRIEAREILQDHANEYPVKTLYYYDNGEVTVVAENVLDVRQYNGALMYNTTENFEKTVKLEELAEDMYGDAISIEDIFAINYETENYVIRKGETKQWQMSASAAETHAEAVENGYVYLYFTDKEAYMEEENGALSVASIKNGVVEDFEIVTDDADVLSVGEERLYYLRDVYESKDCAYGDLYQYIDGEEVCLAKDVLYDRMTIYEDDMFIVYTDYRSGSGYELTMFNKKGEEEVSAEEVTQYIRVDKSTLLYISDGDLYLYNGKEERLVQEDVEWLWSLNSMGISTSLYGYDYAESSYYW